MFKRLSFFMVLLFCLSFLACGNGSDSKDGEKEVDKSANPNLNKYSIKGVVYSDNEGIEGVTVTLNGDSNETVLTNSEGGYKFDELGQAFTASLKPFLKDHEFNSKKLLNGLNSSGNKNQIKATLGELKKLLKPYWRID